MSTTVKNVFITGGNRGIGLELVKQINKVLTPQHLFVTYRNPDQAKELHDLANQNPNIHLIQLEITNFGKYDEIARNVDEMTGGTGINLLINNSAIMNHSKQSLSDLDAKDFTDHFLINSVAPILFTKAFVPLLKKAASVDKSKPLGIGRAVVLNVSTQMASIDDNSSGGYYPYRMSKTALNIGNKSLSIDLKPDNILAVVIHPGWVQTDMGGKTAPLTVEVSVSGIVNVIGSLNESHNGKFLQWNGKELPW